MQFLDSISDRNPLHLGISSVREASRELAVYCIEVLNEGRHHK